MMWQNLSSAAVVTGALRVKLFFNTLAHLIGRDSASCGGSETTTPRSRCQYRGYNREKLDQEAESSKSIIEEI